MGRGAGMGQPGSPKGHHLWGGGRVPGARKDPRYGTRTRDGATWFSQRSPSMGGAACQEHERTPDMGRGAGMVRPDAPQRSPSMGCAACKEHEKTPDMGRGAGMVRPEAPKGHHLWGERHARGTKGPHLWGRMPGLGRPEAPKGHHLWGACPTGLRPAACWPLLGWAVVERGEDVEALPSCGGCACATAGA